MDKSTQMRRVRTKNTEPEMDVRRSLTQLGVRYRCHPAMPGRPDVFIPRLRLAVFVNGCFWHGHACPQGKFPVKNAPFWKAKIEGNAERDIRTSARLREKGIDSLVIWPCEVYKNRRKLRLLAFLYRCARMAA